MRRPTREDWERAWERERQDPTSGWYGRNPDGALPGQKEEPGQDTLQDILTQDELRKLTAREEAKRLYRIAQAGQKPAPWSKSLAELLAEPDDTPTYRIEGLWLTGGNVVFSAQYKTGKTTMVGNVLRCLADGDPFLGGRTRKGSAPGLEPG